MFPNVKQLRISNNLMDNPKMLTFFNVSPCQEEPLFRISAVCVCLLKIDLFLEWLTYRTFCLFFLHIKKALFSSFTLLNKMLVRVKIEKLLCIYKCIHRLEPSGISCWSSLIFSHRFISFSSF